jgi:predicted dehydrogenase
VIRAAVVGVGAIGMRHAIIYKDDPLSELVAVCDAVKEKADAAAERLGIRAHYSVEEMLDAEEVDLVGVCTSGQDSGGDHYEPTMQAFAAGKMVLGEKPISDDVAEAREMVATAREKDLRYGINLNHRFSPMAARARQWCDEGRLGDLLFCRMSLWIRNPREDEYIHIRALHPHSLDVMRYFCGPATRVQAFFSRAPGRKCWSNISVNIEFAGGALGHLMGSYDMAFQHGIERCEVGGTKARFVLDNVIEDLSLYPHDSDERSAVHMSIFGAPTRFDDTMGLRIHRFLEQVAAGAVPEEIEGSGADGLAVQEIIEAAIQSHENGNCAVEVQNG